MGVIIAVAVAVGTGAVVVADRSVVGDVVVVVVVAVLGPERPRCARMFRSQRPMDIIEAWHLRWLML